MALNLLGIISTLWETWEGFHLEGRNEAALRPLKRGPSGWITRVGGVLSGPLPLLLRLRSPTPAPLGCALRRGRLAADAPRVGAGRQELGARLAAVLDIKERDAGLKEISSWPKRKTA